MQLSLSKVKLTSIFHALKKDGVMIILSSPSGAGKTTLVKMLSVLDNFEVSISHTTRQPRPNEIITKIIFLLMKMNLKG